MLIILRETFSSRASTLTRLFGLINFMSLLPAIILIFAGGIKISSIFLYGASKNSIFAESPNVLMALGIIEIFIGFFVFLGTNAAHVTVLPLAVFFVFFSIGIFNYFSGIKDCGCFNYIYLRPELMLFINLYCLIILLVKLFCLKFSSNFTIRKKLALFCPFFFLAASIGFGVIEGGPSGGFLTKGALRANGLRIFEPNHSTSSDFSDLLESIKTRSTIFKGRWKLVFYNQNCDHCKNVIAQMRKEELDQLEPMKYCYVCIDGRNCESEAIIFNNFGTLDPKAWFIEAPLIAVFVDGNIISHQKGALD